MVTRRLPNYLRMYRKRAGFSQVEVARLLGTLDGAKVSRYERNTRVPTLKTALTYEAIFRTPVSELFAGRFQEAEREATKRAKILSERLGQIEQSKRVVRKLEVLRRTISHRS